MTTIQIQNTSFSFNYTHLAASFTPTQASSLDLLTSGWKDSYSGWQQPSFGFNNFSPYSSLLSAPFGYNNFSVQNGFSSLQHLCHCGWGGLSGFSMQQLQLSMNITKAHLSPLGSMPQAKKAEGEDKFAVHQACVSNVVGNPSNMNNSDHIALAIHDVLKNSKETRAGTSFKAMKSEDLQKALKEQYGIDSEVTKVTDKAGKEITALKFANGAVFADGAGDGKLDTGDYNFAGKVADIEKKYGVKADELVTGMKDQKAALDRLGYTGDTSGILGHGLESTAEQVKYDKELKAFSASLKSKYGVDIQGPMAEELFQQKKLAAQYGIELGDDQMRAMAQQASWASDPRLQLLFGTLGQYGPMGIDTASIFRLAMGLTTVH